MSLAWSLPQVRHPSDRRILFSTSAQSFDSGSHSVLATPSAESISQGALWIPSPLSRSVASNTDPQLTCSNRVWAAVKTPFPWKVGWENPSRPHHTLISSKRGSTDEYPHTHLPPLGHLTVIWKYLHTFHCRQTLANAISEQCGPPATCWSFR